MSPEREQYILVQEFAVSLLWDAVDISDRTLASLLMLLMEHCQERLKSLDFSDQNAAH